MGVVVDMDMDEKQAVGDGPFYGPTDAEAAQIAHVVDPLQTGYEAFMKHPLLASQVAKTNAHTGECPATPDQQEALQKFLKSSVLQDHGFSEVEARKAFLDAQG